MKIILPGGSGQIGTLLARAFLRAAHEVVVLSRKPRAAGPGRTVLWGGKTCGDWTVELEGADVVLNLAGRSVNCRYSRTNRNEIMNSRIDSVRAVGKGIAAAARPPRIWLQAGTATIYSHRYDAPNDEFEGKIGGDDGDDSWRFSIKVAKAWEETFANCHTGVGTRKIMLRSAMVMSAEPGGVFDVLLRLVRFGLGGKAGDGRQYVSWIHEADFVAAINHLIQRDSFEGSVNLCSPQPLPNADFMRILRESWGTRIGMPASRLMLELGAIFLRTETELILKSRRVVPRRLMDDGFDFSFPRWEEAAEDLCARWLKLRFQNRR